MDTETEPRPEEESDAPAACCAPTEQATCCEPAAKEACCGAPEPAPPARCGCR